MPTKDIADKLQKKRKRPVEDEGRNDAKSRFPKLLTSRFQKPKASANADNGHRPQATNAVAAKGSKRIISQSHTAQGDEIP